MLRSKLQSKNSSATNSPSASTSRSALERSNFSNKNDEDDDGASSDSSIDNYFVNPADIDFKSSFFNKTKSVSPAPFFDCNVGVTNLSDADNDEDEPEEKEDDCSSAKDFDFHKLLTKVNNLERAKETIANRAAQAPASASNASVMDVHSLLALGEKQGLSKTKPTCTEHHKKKKKSKSSKVATADSDESDWEEVEGDSGVGHSSHMEHEANASNRSDGLEIHVELPSKQRGGNRQRKCQEDLELAFRRKLNRDLKERQLLLHKVSLLCCFGRSHFYNRLLNNTVLLQAVLKLLPSANAYPPERGTEIKYYQSLTTWFKTVFKLKNQNLYPEKTAKKKAAVKRVLLEQIQRKEARCKQDMVFIFVVLLRGMGLQCRLVVNMQPLPLKPAASDLLTITLKRNSGDNQNAVAAKKAKIQEKAKQPQEKTAEKVEIEKVEQIKAAKEKGVPAKKDKVVEKIKAQNIKKAEIAISEAVPKTKTDRGKNVEKAKNVAKSQKAADNKNEHAKEQKGKSSKKAVIEKDVKGETAKEQEKINIEKASCSSKQAKASQKRTKPLAVDSKHLESKETASSTVLPKVLVQTQDQPETSKNKKSSKPPPPTRVTRSRSKSPNELTDAAVATKPKKQPANKKVTISSALYRNTRSRQKSSEPETHLKIPQLDGADNDVPKKKRPQLEKLQKSRSTEHSDSDEDFEPSPPKKAKRAPVMPPKAKQSLQKDRRVLSDDDEADDGKTDAGKTSGTKRSATAADMWVEVWSDVEAQWVCIDIFKGKVHSVESIRKSASSSFAYVFAFQNDLSIKDVTARYCPNWTTTVRKSRVDKAWLDHAIAPYLGHRNERDIREDHELRRIHEEKPLPTTISEYKNHPLYVLERHLLKFQAIYPPEPPTLGFVRGEPVYARDCVHTLHSREIWLKQARTVKLGEKPYKIVKARPKWDRLTQSVITDQMLDIFGYWQTQDYEPPTAENGLVPRNAYGNVELFKECMLPKKTVHLKLPGLNRICKKLGIDCANAVIGFDFHQGACHPTYDGFVVCEEFADQVTAAWYQDQEDQERKEQEKYEARVYGNWKKLIRGLLIRERLKKKYNF